MRQGASFGLVGGGSVGQTFLARHPWLEAGLGPVTASRFQLASRIANTLRAGYAVAHAADLKECRTILFAVPDNQVDAALHRIAASFDWRGRHAIRCDGSSRGIAPLRGRGAECASIRSIEGLPGWLVVDGDARARRTALLFAEAAGERVIEVRSESTDAFDAGVTFCGTLVAPLLESARRCFAAAGVHESAARRLSEAIAERTIRASFTPPARAVVEREAAGARAAGLERYFRESVTAAATAFKSRGD